MPTDPRLDGALQMLRPKAQGGEGPPPSLGLSSLPSRELDRRPGSMRPVSVGLSTERGEGQSAACGSLPAPPQREILTLTGACPVHLEAWRSRVTWISKKEKFI